MKRFVFCVISLVLTVILFFSVSTLAFFTKRTGTGDDLVAVSGSVSCKLFESTVPAGGGEPILGPTSMQIRPGSSVEKTLTVKNTGSLSVYLRVKVEKQFALSAENKGKPVDDTLVSLALNTAYWEERDGFYYYKLQLLPGKTTEPLMTAVHFAPEMGNTYTNSEITLRIKAYAAQVSDQSVSVFETNNWPAVQ